MLNSGGAGANHEIIHLRAVSQGKPEGEKVRVAASPINTLSRGEVREPVPLMASGDPESGRQEGTGGKDGRAQGKEH